MTTKKLSPLVGNQMSIYTSATINNTRRKWLMIEAQELFGLYARGVIFTDGKTTISENRAFTHQFATEMRRVRPTAKTNIYLLNFFSRPSLRTAQFMACSRVNSFASFSHSSILSSLIFLILAAYCG